MKSNLMKDCVKRRFLQKRYSNRIHNIVHNIIVECFSHIKSSNSGDDAPPDASTLEPPSSNVDAFLFQGILAVPLSIICRVCTSSLSRGDYCDETL